MSKVDLGNYGVTLECGCDTAFVDPPSHGEYAYCADHGDTEVFEAHDNEIDSTLYDTETFDEFDPVCMSNLHEYHAFVVCWRPSADSYVWYFIDKQDGFVNEADDNDSSYTTAKEAYEDAVATCEMIKEENERLSQINLHELQEVRMKNVTAPPGKEIAS